MAHSFPLIVAVLVLLSPEAPAETISECRELLRTGQYQKCVRATEAAIEKKSYGEDWPLLQAEAQMRLGRYSAASDTLKAGLDRYAWSVRMRMQAYRLTRFTGQRELRSSLLDEINGLATDSPWRYTDADDLVAMGNAAIELGADPKDVLDGFFNRARRNYKTRPDGFLAAGRLAILKGDLQLAAEVLRPAAEKFADNPDILFALSEAESSSERTSDLINEVLAIDAKYEPALLWVAQRQIDAESYQDAEETLRQILQVNSASPNAHALQAVIHHLLGRSEEERASMKTALKVSGPAAETYWLIGERLSAKYRFAEGADYQRQALAADPTFLSARTQLAQDLMRLGEDGEGWALAEEAQRQDKYSTQLFNLMSLKDSLDKFTAIQNDHFTLRMAADEADAYGGQAEALLNDAFAVLTEKYGFAPDAAVVVEIFDRKDDFAVRTFGLPDVAGFLGVCFGRVITANSPASQRESPSNWHSVLWHEFCHVITLQMTANRIPRWLSEGISVYEERQLDRRWGQSMSPQFRRRILDGNITPVSQLSSAFLKAGSGEDLNFAYYQSSMVVEFVVEEFGFEALLGILKSLRDGITINDSLGRYTAAVEELDPAFEAWLVERAKAFAPGVAFDLPERSPAAAAYLQNPKNYAAGIGVAIGLLRDENFEAAERELKALVKLFPGDSGPQSARRLLARVYQQTDRPDLQRDVLQEHLAESCDDFEAARQLLDLQVKGKRWADAVQTGRRLLQIDPLRPAALRQILRAAESQQDIELQRSMLNALLATDAANGPQWHYQLAVLLQDSDRSAARRHVLLALEKTPRYRAAHQLLLKLQDSPETNSSVETSPSERASDCGWEPPSRPSQK